MRLSLRVPSLFAALLLLGSPLMLLANSLSIDDVSGIEGDGGQTPFVFTVTLDSAQPRPISVDVQTQDGSATLADGDYVALATTLTFAPGEVTQQLTVLVNGDTAVEDDETFSVVLSNPVGGAALVKPVGIGTILNDDSVPTPTPTPTPAPTAAPTPTPTPTTAPTPLPTSAPTPTPEPIPTPTPTTAPTPAPPTIGLQLTAEIAPVIVAAGQTQRLRVAGAPLEALSSLNLRIRIYGAQIPGPLPTACASAGSEPTVLNCALDDDAPFDLDLPLLAQTGSDTHTVIVARASERSDLGLHVVGQSGERFARAPTQSLPIPADAAVYSPRMNRLYVVGATGLFAVDPLRASVESQLPLQGADDGRWIVLLRDDVLAYGGPATALGLVTLAADGALDQIRATGLAGATDGAAADLDGDGRVDLAVVDDEGLRVYALTLDGGLNPLPASGPRALRLTAGDLDGDGYTDLVLIDDDGLWLLYGAGGASFAPAVRIAAAGASSAAGIDGEAGLVIGRATTADLEPPSDLHLRAVGDRGYSEGSPIGKADTVDVLALPTDPGGKARILRLSASGGHRLHCLADDADGPLTIVSPGARRAIAADIDGDGRSDLVLSRGLLGLEWYTDLERASAAPQTTDAGGGAVGGALLLLAACAWRNRRYAAGAITGLLFPGWAGAAILLPVPSSEAEPQTLTLTAEALAPPQTYRLEVDGLDVSALLRIDAGEGAGEDEWTLRYTPPQPLGGTVAVRLYRGVPGAQPQGVGEWSIELPRPDTPRWQAALDASFHGHTLVDAERALKAQLAPRETTDGSVRPQLGYRAGDLALAGNADVLWNTRQPGSQGDPDLGRFRLQAGYRQLSLIAGPQNIGPQAANLLVDRAQRRGLSLNLANGPWGSSAQGYVTRFGPLQGFREGFGIGDPNRRIAGGYLGLAPLQGEDHHLHLRLGAVQVQAPLDGPGGERRLENLSRSVALDARFGGWTLASEVAHSETAAEGVFAAYTGDALRTQLRYDASPAEWRGWPLAWSGSVQHQRVSAFYESRAQFGLPADEQRTEAAAELSLGRLGIQTAIGEARDNLDRRPIGQVAATLWNLSATLFPGDGPVAWYGAPTWQAAAREQRNRQRRAHPEIDVPAVDDRAADYEIGLRLDHEHWYAGLSQRRTQTEDVSFTRATDHSALDLGLQPLALGASITWTPTMALLRTRDRGDGNVEFVFEAGAGIGIEPGGAWGASLDARYSRGLGDDRLLDDRQWLLMPTLYWNLPVGDERRLALALNGNYQASRFGAERIEDWSLLLSATLNLSWKYDHAR